MSEHTEQVLLFQWIDLMKGQIPELELAFAVPNGGHRHKAVAAKLRAEGVKAGVPDIFIACPREKTIVHYQVGAWSEDYSGLFIEMKAGKNKTTPAQDEWITRLSKAGYKVAVCYGFEEAKQTILEYLEVKE
jgi:hypothetical protein